MTNEHATRCECGHSLNAHDTEDGPCSKCDCVEYDQTRVCLHCGNVHDPDVSDDLAAEATW